MKPTLIGFEKRYNDDSGVEYGVRVDSTSIIFTATEDEVYFPIDELDWLIGCLATIKDMQEKGK